MTTIQILYSTAEGQARCIADQVAGQLRAKGFSIQCENVGTAVMRVKPTAVLLIASIHLGRHAGTARDFVKRNLPYFNEIPSAFMSVSLSASEADRTQAQTYITEFLEETGWHPELTATIAGALRYTAYGFFKKRMIRKIAMERHLPTDISVDHEFTDWNEVAAFVEKFASALQEAVPA